MNFIRSPTVLFLSYENLIDFLLEGRKTMTKKIFRKAITILVIMTMLITSSVSVFAYSFMTGGKLNTVPISMYVHTGVNSSYIPSIQSAMSTWNGAGKGTLITYAGTRPGLPLNNDGINMITSGYMGTQYALAVTTIWHDSSGTIHGADVDINISHPYSTALQATLFDLESVMTHELGHVVGLNHSSHNEATMFSSISKNEKIKRSLHQDDISGLTALGY